jgi:Reverse transcriptase (RNA-dependent DNA polymerase)
MRKSIQSAVANIAAFGDTDIFPFSFEQHIFHDRPELLVEAIEQLHQNFDDYCAKHGPDNVNTLVPVGYTGFRWATQIDPLWNAYYLALVVELGSEIEKVRIPVSENAVFSYRFVEPTGDGRIFNDAVNWHEFIQACLDAAGTYSHVIMCDVSDFYSRIYHHKIESALRWLETKPDTSKRLTDLLKVFSGSVSYGLPIGGPASRVLAELALNSVDKLLRSEGVRFCRFVDDYRIFCASQEEAYRRLIFLSEKLFDQGLSLQKTKTRIVSGKEFREEAALLLRMHQVEEQDLTDEDRVLRLTIHFDPYSETRVDDYERLKEQVSKVDIAGILGRELEKTRIDPIVTKQAISAIRVLDSEPRKAILRTLLEPNNLHTLAPVFPRLMTVLRGLYPELDFDAQEIIDTALLALVRFNSHLTCIDLNLAYLVRVLRRRSTQEKELLFVRLFKAETASTLVRREIILAMTEWGHNHWVADLKKKFGSGLSKWERRCFIVSSYFLRDEGRHWRHHNDSSFDPTEQVVRRWFQDRFQTNPTVPQ